jgi:hypothetical protein
MKLKGVEVSAAVAADNDENPKKAASKKRRGENLFWKTAIAFHSREEAEKHISSAADRNEVRARLNKNANEDIRYLKCRLHTEGCKWECRILLDKTQSARYIRQESTASVHNHSADKERSAKRGLPNDVKRVLDEAIAVGEMQKPAVVGNSMRSRNSVDDVPAPGSSLANKLAYERLQKANQEKIAASASLNDAESSTDVNNHVDAGDTTTGTTAVIGELSESSDNALVAGGNERGDGNSALLAKDTTPPSDDSALCNTVLPVAGERDAVLVNSAASSSTSSSSTSATAVNIIPENTTTDSTESQSNSTDPPTAVTDSNSRSKDVTTDTDREDDDRDGERNEHTSKRRRK